MWPCGCVCVWSRLSHAVMPYGSRGRVGLGWREPLPGARRAGGRAFTQGGIAAYRGGTNPISEFAHTTNHIFLSTILRSRTLRRDLGPGVPPDRDPPCRVAAGVVKLCQARNRVQRQCVNEWCVRSARHGPPDDRSELGWRRVRSEDVPWRMFGRPAGSTAGVI